MQSIAIIFKCILQSIAFLLGISLLVLKFLSRGEKKI